MFNLRLNERFKERIHGKDPPVFKPEGIPFDRYHRRYNFEDILKRGLGGVYSALVETEHYDSTYEQTHAVFDYHATNPKASALKITETRTPTEMRVGMIRLAQYTVDSTRVGQVEQTAVKQTLSIVRRFLGKYFTETIDNRAIFTDLERIASELPKVVTVEVSRYTYLGKPKIVGDRLLEVVDYYRNNELPDLIIGCVNGGNEFSLALSALLQRPIILKKITKVSRQHDCLGDVEINLDNIDISGKTALIVDDNVQYGETMVFTLEHAASLGARDPYGVSINKGIPSNTSLVREQTSPHFYRFRRND